MKKVPRIFSLALLLSISGATFAAGPEPEPNATPGTGTPGTETPGTGTPGTETPGTETPGTGAGANPRFCENNGWFDRHTSFLDIFTNPSEKLPGFAWLYKKNRIIARTVAIATACSLVFDNAHVKQGIDKVKKAVGCTNCQKIDELEEEDIDIHGI